MSRAHIHLLSTPAELSDRVRADFGTYGDAKGNLLTVAVDPDRTVRTQMAFYALGEAAAVSARSR